MSKVYAVAKGRRTGIYSSWAECEAQIRGFRGALFESFKTMQEAADYLETHGILYELPKESKPVLSPQNVYHVFTDGGCVFNPAGIGGCGIVIVSPDGTERSFLRGFKSSTNNRMEIMAVIIALQNTPKNVPIYLYSDSKYVIETMLGHYKKSKNQDLWDLLDEEVNKHAKITWNWVKGHNGHCYNERCDQLATKAQNMDQLFDDVGYQVGHEEVKQPCEHFHASIQEEHYVFSMETIEEEAKRRKCNSKSIELIRKFYEKDIHSFDDYLSLKTGGKDELSRIKEKEELAKLIGMEKYEYLRSQLKSDTELCASVRWVARGLLLQDAVSKAAAERVFAEKLYAEKQMRNHLMFD